jgi:uncharacterized protein (UPF0548 family)
VIRLVVGRGGPTATTLARWQARRRTDEPRAGLRHDRHETAVAIPPGTDAEAAFADAVRRLSEYRIFPGAILQALVGTPDGRVREGATVVFHAHLPLVPLAVEGGVRVVGTWDRELAEGRDAGFEIATLAGHPERGSERFTVHLDRAGQRLTFVIEAWSRPASTLVRLAGPLGRAIQVRAKRAATREFARALATGMR